MHPLVDSGHRRVEGSEDVITVYNISVNGREVRARTSVCEWAVACAPGPVLLRLLPCFAVSDVVRDQAAQAQRCRHKQLLCDAAAAPKDATAAARHARGEVARVCLHGNNHIVKRLCLVVLVHKDGLLRAHRKKENRNGEAPTTVLLVLLVLLLPLRVHVLLHLLGRAERVQTVSQHACVNVHDTLRKESARRVQGGEGHSAQR
mmetsp:Transcript_380/g.871  ORF Transcript_380/g.871 Transcript_380/m.871 type:complete len:204 (-) Transcript_380:224-835(-)